MKTVGNSYSKLSIVIFSLVALVALGIPMCGQEAAITVGDVQITGVVDDWSHHHLVFSNPGTAEEAKQKGTYEQWLKIVNDPRYVMHQLKRGLPTQGPFAEAVAMRQNQAAAIAAMEREPVTTTARKSKKTKITKDWSMSLAGSTTTGAMAAGQYPAEYSFSTSTASCSDYVVFPTGLAGSSTQATVITYNNLYDTTCGTKATRPGIAWAYNTGGTANLSPTLSYDGTQVAYIQTSSSASTTLRAAMTNSQTTASVTSGTGIGNGGYILIGAEDMLVTAGGGTTTLTVIRGQLGTTAVAHNIGRTVTTLAASSLVLLRPLSTSGGTVGSPATISYVIPANYHSSCTSSTAPCYTTILLSGAPNDTNSAPFYLYDGSDTMYVGDNSGKLHQFKGVFLGTPTESGSPWPVTATDPSATTRGNLTSPVFDSGSQLVFVGDARNGSFTGRIHSVNASTGVVADYGNTLSIGAGIIDGPVVDPSAGHVYVVTGDDNFISGGACGSTYCPAVWQFTTDVTRAPAETTVGQNTGGSDVIYDGTFDNTYFTSVSPASPTGKLYVCGEDSSGNGNPTLYQIAITTGTMAGTATKGPALTNGAATCSPMTEILGITTTTTLSASMTNSQTTASVTSGTGIANTDYIQVDSEIMEVTGGGGTTNLTVARAQQSTTAASHANGAAVADIKTQDWIYASVTASGNETNCTGACLYNFNVTSGTVPAHATTGITATGGTGGIVFDNSSAVAGASQIYYSTLGTATCVGNGTTGSGSHGCAVQASQTAP